MCGNPRDVSDQLSKDASKSEEHPGYGAGFLARWEALKPKYHLNSHARQIDQKQLSEFLYSCTEETFTKLHPECLAGAGLGVYVKFLPEGWERVNVIFPEENAGEGACRTYYVENHKAHCPLAQAQAQAHKPWCPLAQAKAPAPAPAQTQAPTQKTSSYCGP